MKPYWISNICNENECDENISTFVMTNKDAIESIGYAIDAVDLKMLHDTNTGIFYMKTDGMMYPIEARIILDGQILECDRYDNIVSKRNILHSINTDTKVIGCSLGYRIITDKAHVTLYMEYIPGDAGGVLMNAIIKPLDGEINNCKIYLKIGKNVKITNITKDGSINALEKFLIKLC